MSRAAPQPAFVLHQWDWSETSLILDVFSRPRGRLAVVAKGAKRPYSQLRPVLMPFQRVLLGFGTAKADEAGEILTLRGAEYAGAGAVLPTGRLMSGFYLNELLLKLLARGDPHEALFDAYADTLQALAAEPDDAPLRAFELVLLREIGLLPELDRDTPSQAPLQPGRGYRLQAEAGLVVADRASDRPTDRTTDGEALLDAAQARALEQALSRGRLPALREACRLNLAALRQQLRPVLHYHLGSPVLRTRQLMLEVRRLIDSPPPSAAPAVPAAHAAPPP